MVLQHKNCLWHFQHLQIREPHHNVLHLLSPLFENSSSGTFAMIFKTKHDIHVVSWKQEEVSYHDVLDDLLHQKLICDHMAPELPVLHQ